MTNRVFIPFKLTLLQPHFGISVFMSPPTESNSIPSDDPLVRGVLEVHSPSDRWIDGIEIKLQGLQSIAIVDAGMRTGTEESIVFEKVLNLGSEAAERKSTKWKVFCFVAHIHDLLLFDFPFVFTLQL